MRDFFINSLEKLVNVIVVLLGLAILVAAIAATVSGSGQSEIPKPILGLMILVGGGIYLVLVGGFLYMGIGIYQNTKRTADALEKLSLR